MLVLYGKPLRRSMSVQRNPKIVEYIINGMYEPAFLCKIGI